MGHNIYGFNNVVLEIALPQDHAYNRFFKGVTKTSNKTAPSVGLMLNIRAINDQEMLTSFVRVIHCGKHSLMGIEYINCIGSSAWFKFECDRNGDFFVFEHDGFSVLDTSRR